MTRSTIYSDLEKSVFTFKTDNFIFYFSSLFYLNKYSEGIEEFRNKMRRKFTTLYLIPVDVNDYADIVYYSRVEKRGFYIISRDAKEVINWLGSITLDGRIKMKEN